MTPEEWVSVQSTPKLREIANTVVQHVQHISQAQYLDQIHLMLTDFAKKLGNKRYVVLLAQHEESVGANQISTALKSVEIRKPEAVLKLETISSYLKKHPKTKQVLLVSAPAFNPRQVRRRLESVMTGLNVEFYIGIPYMTRAVENYFSCRIMLAHQAVPTLTDVLDEQSIGYAKRLGLSEFTESTALTYFNDFEVSSTFRAFRERDVLWTLNGDVLLEDFLKSQNLPLTTKFSEEDVAKFDAFVMTVPCMEAHGMFFLDQSAVSLAEKPSHEELVEEKEPEHEDFVEEDGSSICSFM